MKPLTLRALSVFETAASLGSFSKAADHLDMTQPAVSMQVRQIEAALGVALFDSHSRRHLTDAGRELLQHARLILAQVRAAEEAVTAYGPAGAGDAQGSGLRGMLHLGVVSSAHYFAPQLMQAFNSLHPLVRLKLTVARRDEVLAMLCDHALDIAISGYPPSEADLEAVTFARNPHCLVVHPGHRLVGRPQLPWTELRDEPFIVREPGSATRQFLEHLLQSQSMQPRSSIEMAGNETVKQAVMCGMGVGFLSAHTFQVELQAARLAVLDMAGLPRWVDWCVVQRRDRRLEGVHAAMRDFVVERGAEWARCRIG
jgi:DNA-binding transcriptional LysR family regulator